jgi:hypothetical protein
MSNQPPISGRFVESQRTVTNREFPNVSAMGSRNKLNAFTRDDDLNTLIKDGNDPNFSDAGKDSPNSPLGIKDSFLYYPQDLGRNQRYHHFITFNIYQGTSDEIRMEQREINLATSAINAAGFDRSGGGQQLKENRSDIVNLLIRNGFGNTAQAEKFVDAFIGATASALVVDGVTANERITLIDDLVQGQINNIFGDQLKQQDTEGDGGFYDRTVAAGKGVYEVGKQGVNDIIEFAKTFIEASTRDNWADVKDDNRVGVSGRAVTKSKKERAILTANRRFNLANVKSKDTICLYMPLKITFNDQLIYSESDLGMAKTLFDAITLKRGAPSALVEKAGVGLVSGLLDSVMSTVGLESVNLADVRSASTRSVSNPRREALFKDVAMRQHTFSFEFAPNNVREAQTVLDIIKMFRYHAHPGLLGGGGHFFTFPAEFEVTFYTITPQGAVLVNDNLPKIPRVALTSIAVDYSGAGDYKTFTDAKPAFIKLDLTFQEMEQLTNEHIINGY